MSAALSSVVEFTALNWLLWLITGGLLFVLPGWALGSALLPRWSKLHRLEKPGLAIGLSLAIYPLIMLWSDVVGLRLGGLLAWAPLLAGVFWASIKAWQAWKSANRPIWRIEAAEICFLILLLSVAVVRILAVHGLEIPLWGDSLQHSMITQLMLDNGGLFNDWSPYADLITFTYHFGFHASAAAFAWVTHLPAPQAVLVFGQVLNILAIASLATLAMRVYPSPWSAAAALAIGGLMLWHPNSYTQWGRYTQLSGQAILPAAICLGWEVLDHPPQRLSEWLPPCLALGGLALTHYRVLIFAAVFFVACLAVNWLWKFVVREPGISASSPTSLQSRGQPEAQAWVRLAALATGGGMLFLPWLLRLSGGRLLLNLGSRMTTFPAQLSEFARSYNAFGNLPAYLPGWVWPAIAAVVAWAFIERRKPALVVTLWWALLLLATNPEWLGLPGSGVISNFAYWIAAYIPAAALIGAGIGRVIDAAYHRFPARLVTTAAMLAAVLLGIAGSLRRINDLDVATHTLVTPADLAAMHWIRANTPEEARFLVNSLAAYGGSIYAGSDAGWWLPLLAGRAVTQPPLNYGQEAGPRADYTRWINTLPKTVAAKGPGHFRTLSLLRERKVEYVFIGSRQTGSNSILVFEEFLTDPHFRLVYQKDKVYIFKVAPGAE